MVYGDYNDKESLHDALRGAFGVFANTGIYGGKAEDEKAKVYCIVLWA